MRDEGVQGVLTLFCSGAAQVCHDVRVVELKEQLEVEEEYGDRQEEEVEVESGETSQGECAMDGMEMTCECAQNLSHDARYVQTQCMLCATQSSKSTSSLVYLLCMVSCLLLCASFQFFLIVML